MKNEFTIKDCIKMNDGNSIPRFGLGVWRAKDGDETKKAVLWALEAGYRSIDTASLYANEKSVGQAMRESGVPREEVFLTTKVWMDDLGYENTLKAFDKSMERLGADYIDLYLIHRPVPELHKETWHAMEELVSQGKVRSIGVSNFTAEHIEDILSDCKIKPVLNQIECNPYWPQKELVLWHEKHNILTECWAPIAKGMVLEEEKLSGLAAKYDKTAVQIVLRWHLQKNFVVIPKSVHRERIVKNAGIFDFKLSEEDMILIDGLDRTGRNDAHPWQKLV